jgi:hypothetical protein
MITGTPTLTSESREEKFKQATRLKIGIEIIWSQDPIISAQSGVYDAEAEKRKGTIEATRAELPEFSIRALGLTIRESDAGVSFVELQFRIDVQAAGVDTEFKVTIPRGGRFYSTRWQILFHAVADSILRIGTNLARTRFRSDKRFVLTTPFEEVILMYSWPWCGRELEVT